LRICGGLPEQDSSGRLERFAVSGGPTLDVNHMDSNFISSFSLPIILNGHQAHATALNALDYVLYLHVHRPVRHLVRLLGLDLFHRQSLHVLHVLP
jgi:hypothetical protein